MAPKSSLLTAVLACASAIGFAGAAEAHHHLGPNHLTHGRAHHARHYASSGARVIQCVAFARSDSGVDLSGNAADWWDNAAGIYARGNNPEIGSVLNFRATERMRFGHVAVVSDVVDNRTVVIDQSHWGRAGVSRDVRVVDVSADNDWSAVRVELGHQGDYGSIYPTYGFIYPRPAGSGPTLTEARLRPRHHATLEFAEAPSIAARSITMRSIDLNAAPPFVADAPDRAFR